MKKEILLFSILIFATAFIAAAPPLPCAFYGDVTLNNVSLQNGYTITTKINNVVNSECQIIDGRYGNGPNACVVTSEQNGVKVNFYICNDLIGNATFVDKGIIELDFNLVNPLSCAPTPYCGDQSCNNGETCSTCATDCGACSSSSSSSSSGSSGGGGGGSSRSSPTIIKTNETNNTLVNLSTTVAGNLEEETENQEDVEPEQKSGFAKFVESSAGKGIILIIVIVIIGLIIVKNNRKEKDSVIDKKVKEQIASTKEPEKKKTKTSKKK